MGHISTTSNLLASNEIKWSNSDLEGPYQSIQARFEPQVRKIMKKECRYEKVGKSVQAGQTYGNIFNVGKFKINMKM